MSVPVISSKLAAALDAELMGPKIGYTLEQLMELAGLSVAQAVYRHWPPPPRHKKKVFIVSGPGNNGGDGLVCARHLKLFGYDPVVYYPKRSAKQPFYTKLVSQLESFDIPVLPMDHPWKKYLEDTSTLCVVDAIFGFSFKPPIREPFVEVLAELKKHEHTIPIVSVDVPSSWDIDDGPLDAESIVPRVLVSLTAPKPCALHINSSTTHYLGGRFVPTALANKYGLEAFPYEGEEQVLRL